MSKTTDNTDVEQKVERLVEECLCGGNLFYITRPQGEVACSKCYCLIDRVTVFCYTENSKVN